MMMAVLRVMMLGLLRDRGALVLAFVLPAAIFLIFASIFAASGNDKLPLKVAVGDLAATPASQRLADALRGEPSFLVRDPAPTGRAETEGLVREGVVDVGILIGRDLAETRAAPIDILVEPSKLMAGAIVSGRVQDLFARRMPDLVLSRTAMTLERVVGSFTPEQSARLAAAVKGSLHSGDAPSSLLAMGVVGRADATSATITYYAGAVAILFLLFSSLQSAATMIEERQSGILDRIAVGPGGIRVVVLGKVLFLTLQGVLQVGLIFLVAQLVYGVDVTDRIGLWLVITVASAFGAAGLALAVATASTTRQQAHTVSTFLVLTCSAVGGSMVPRFMMPGWLQDVGRFTPNTWAIEAYYGAFWRQETLPDVLPEIVCLVALALFGTGFALIVSQRRLRF